MCYKLVTKLVSFRVVLEVVVETFFDKNLDETSFAVTLAALNILLIFTILNKSFLKDLEFFLHHYSILFLTCVKAYHLL